jgi:hypothetical protein
MAALALGLTVFAWLLFFPDLHAARQLFDPHSYGRAHSLLRLFAWTVPGAARLFSIERLWPIEWAVLLPSIALLIAWRANKVDSVERIAAELGAVFLVVLLAGARFCPWYVTWLLPAVVASSSPAVRAGALVLSYTALFVYIPYGWQQAALAGSFATFVPPSLLLMWMALRKRSRRGRETGAQRAGESQRGETRVPSGPNAGG